LSNMEFEVESIPVSNPNRNVPNRIVSVVHNN
jgi:hypothetical protein